jgi:transposase
MNAKYIVTLSQSERDSLTEVVKKGKAAAYRIKHANILLKADENGPAWPVKRIAEAFSVHRNTVRNVSQRLVEGGLETALARKKRKTPPRSEKLNEEAKKKLYELASGHAPEGEKRWTLKLLAGRMVELEIVDSISLETVRKALKKTDKTPHHREMVHTSGK